MYMLHVRLKGYPLSIMGENGPKMVENGRGGAEVLLPALVRLIGARYDSDGPNMYGW